MTQGSLLTNQDSMESRRVFCSVAHLVISVSVGNPHTFVAQLGTMSLRWVFLRWLMAIGLKPVTLLCIKTWLIDENLWEKKGKKSVCLDSSLVVFRTMSSTTKKSVKLDRFYRGANRKIVETTTYCFWKFSNGKMWPTKPESFSNMKQLCRVQS